MRRQPFIRAAVKALMLMSLSLAACAGHGAPIPDQVTGTVVEDKPVITPCVPADYQHKPAVPTRAQIAAADGPTQFDLLGQYFVLMDPWASQADGVVTACQQAPAAPPT